MATRKGINLDPALAGKQLGYLLVSGDAEAPSAEQVRVPAGIVQGSEGPTVAFIGGLRRGESVGQVALQRLARQLPGDAVNGRVIILPNLAIDLPESLAFTDSGLDATGNVPRAAADAASQRLAIACTAPLLSASTLVVTIGAGGRGLCYQPTAAITRQGSTQQQAGAEAAMIAFGAPNSLRYQHLPDTDRLGAKLIDSGASYLTTRLGGGCAADESTLDLALSGCLNILNTLGMLDVPFTLRATRMLRRPDERYTIASPGHGMPVLVRRIGHEVYRGEPVARLFDPLDLAADPLDVLSPVDGILLAGFQGTLARPGDVLAVLADEVAA